MHSFFFTQVITFFSTTDLQVLFYRNIYPLTLWPAFPNYLSSWFVFLYSTCILFEMWHQICLILDVCFLLHHLNCHQKYDPNETGEKYLGLCNTIQFENVRLLAVLCILWIWIYSSMENRWKKCTVFLSLIFSSLRKYGCQRWMFFTFPERGDETS